MQANREIWTYSAMMKMLQGVIKASNIDELQQERVAAIAVDPSALLLPPTSNAAAMVGYFSLIEAARLECLVGDYVESLRHLSSIRLWDKREWFTLVPSCHVNLFYHAGLCQLMIRRYGDALDTFSDVVLHVSRVLKPGSAPLRSSAQGQLQKMLDKVMALTAISISLCPGYAVDDQVDWIAFVWSSPNACYVCTLVWFRACHQVREMVEKKWEDRFRRLQSGDLAAFEGLFELSCPKFISPAVPDYEIVGSIGTDAYRHQVRS